MGTRAGKEMEKKDGRRGVVGEEETGIKIESKRRGKKNCAEGTGGRGDVESVDVHVFMAYLFVQCNKQHIPPRGANDQLRRFESASDSRFRLLVVQHLKMIALAGCTWAKISPLFCPTVSEPPSCQME